MYGKFAPEEVNEDLRLTFEWTESNKITLTKNTTNLIFVSRMKDQARIQLKEKFIESQRDESI